MSVICIICARKGSQGLKGKNLKILHKKPLIAHTIIQAQKSKIFDKIVVSTDSKKIQKVANKYGIKNFFLRPAYLSKNNSPKIPVIRHALLKSELYYKKKFKIIIDLDPTSPLRNIKDIKKSLNLFNRNKYQNLISGCTSSKNPYFNMVEKKNNKIKIVKNLKKKITRRQNAPKVFDMNASIYIWKRFALLNNIKLINKKTGFYQMPRDRSIDIDIKLDWDIVNFLMRKKK